MSSSRTMRVTSWAGESCCVTLAPMRLLLDARGELAHDRQGHVGLEQREADLAQGGVEVVVGEVALAAQLLEDSVEPIAETFEHP